ncbi:hypothetical protein [Glycomyces buryatensis]|uniref:Uncharacterized protein n=1 Tax=Glycomyces buryatensis TaxID=2570927 RepID=A0A4S8QDN5_9ACTN|nr:hypothetical protein [Glycomyces buryatensis]THV42420.1 hypothetical protein FAB82_07135 [Glycomyces buryatensis]
MTKSLRGAGSQRRPWVIIAAVSVLIALHSCAEITLLGKAIHETTCAPGDYECEVWVGAYGLFFGAAIVFAVPMLIFAFLIWRREIAVWWVAVVHTGVNMIAAAVKIFTADPGQQPLLPGLFWPVTWIEPADRHASLLILASLGLNCLCLALLVLPRMYQWYREPKLIPTPTM